MGGYSRVDTAVTYWYCEHMDTVAVGKEPPIECPRCATMSAEDRERLIRSKDPDFIA